MADLREELISKIDADRERLITFLSGFLQAPSPNPPGDTQLACRHVSEFLKSEGVAHEVLHCDPILPNIAASFEANQPGRHLTLNGHIDVFPISDENLWEHSPWGGAVADGFIWGRGAVDMKAGTTAAIFTYMYLCEIKDQLKGKLSLTVVSDEETLGPAGTKYLLESNPHLRGDCCLNGEPSGAHTVRFGEKGLLWLELRVKTGGGHGAYPHLSRSANKIAAKLILDLEQLTEMTLDEEAGDCPALSEAYAHAEKHLGTGAGKVAQSVVVNIGQIQGGVKVNVLPASCVVHVDIRIPFGLSVEDLLGQVRRIVSAYPEVEVVELRRSEPNMSNPDHPLSLAMLKNSRSIRGVDVQPGVGLGASDARLWRELGIPAFIHGPSPKTMGAIGERIQIEEFIDVVKIHCLSAFDYLMGEESVNIAGGS